MSETIVTATDESGHFIGHFKSVSNAKEYIREERDLLQPYEADYWKGDVGDPDSVTLI